MWPLAVVVVDVDAEDALEVAAPFRGGVNRDRLASPQHAVWFLQCRLIDAREPVDDAGGGLVEAGIELEQLVVCLA